MPWPRSSSSAPSPKGGCSVSKPPKGRDRPHQETSSVPPTLTGTAAAAGRLYAATARRLVPPFLALAALTSLLFYVPLPEALLFVVLIALVVVPAILGTGVLALTSVLLRDAEGDPTLSPGGAAASLRPLYREILAAGMMAGMVGLALVMFLRGLGLLLLPLVYGPPVLIQVLAVEAKPLRLAWPRTRELMRRNWGRVLATLLSVLFVITMVRTVLLATVYGLVQNMADPWPTALLGVLQVLVVGLTLPYFAAVQYVTYSGLAGNSEAR